MLMLDSQRSEEFARQTPVCRFSRAKGDISRLPGANLRARYTCGVGVSPASSKEAANGWFSPSRPECLPGARLAQVGCEEPKMAFLNNAIDEASNLHPDHDDPDGSPKGVSTPFLDGDVTDVDVRSLPAGTLVTVGSICLVNPAPRSTSYRS